MKYFLKHITEITLPMGIFLSVACIGLWVPDIVGAESAWPIYLTLAITAFNTFLLMSLMYQTGVSRNRSGLPLFLYALAIGTQTSLHTDWKGQLCTTILMLVLFILCRTYRKENCAEEAFQTTCMVCLSSFLVQDMAGLIVFLWLAFALQRAFNLRVWLSTLVAVGLVAVYIAIFSYMGWITSYSITPLFSRHLLTFPSLYQQIATWLILGSGWFFVGVSLSHFSIENSSVQSIILLLVLFLLASTLSICFPSANPSLLGIATICAAGIAAQVFTSHQSVFRGVCFLVFILLNIVAWVLPHLF